MGKGPDLCWRSFWVTLKPLNGQKRVRFWLEKHEIWLGIWLETSRSEKNGSVFGPFGVQKWTKNCLKLVQGVPLGYLEGPDLCWRPLGSQTVQHFENFEPKNLKNGQKRDVFQTFQGLKMVQMEWKWLWDGPEGSINPFLRVRPWLKAFEVQNCSEFEPKNLKNGQKRDVFQPFWGLKLVRKLNPSIKIVR